MKKRKTRIIYMPISCSLDTSFRPSFTTMDENNQKVTFLYHEIFPTAKEALEYLADVFQWGVEYSDVHTFNLWVNKEDVMMLIKEEKND